MTGQDYYQVLGVSRHATPAELRAAFVRLAKRHHPDQPHAGVGLPYRLREVQQAYRCLIDADRRAAHDRMLDERERIHFASQRAIQRRLRRYDRRYPRRQPRSFRAPRWRSLLVVACGAAAIAKLSITFLA